MISPSTAGWLLCLCIIAFISKTAECSDQSILETLYERLVSWVEPELHLLKQTNYQQPKTASQVKLLNDDDIGDFVPIPVKDSIMYRTIKAFEYDVFEVQMPQIERLYGDVIYLGVYVTLYVGDVTLYVGVSEPSSFSDNIGFYHTDSLGCLGSYKVKEGVSTVFISVQGSYGAMWSQYALKDGPSISSYSIGVVLHQDDYNLRNSLALKNGVPFVTFPKDYFPVFYTYEAESDEGVFLDFLWISSRVTVSVSTTTPFPNTTNGEIVFRADRTYSRFIPTKKGDTIYISIYTDRSATSQATLMAREGDVDIEILENPMLGMVREDKHRTFNYRFNVLDTGAYKWLEIKFQVISGATLYVRHGARPTTHHYDWKYTPHGKSGSWDSLYISSSDPKFQKGYFYFTIKFSGGVPVNDYFSVSLQSWLPRMI